MELEFNIIATQKPGIVVLENFNELKNILNEKLKNFENLNYIPEEINIAKNDKKILYALKRKIKEKRKELKEEYLLPYNEVDKKLEELLEMIDKPLNQIDEFIKNIELDIKKSIIEKYLNDKNSTEDSLAKIINSPSFSNPKWKNRAYTVTKIKKEIDEKINQAQIDIKAIKESNINNKELLTSLYYETLSLNKCLIIINNLENKQNENKIISEEKEEYKIVKIKGKSSQIDMIINQMKIMNIDYEILEDNMN